MFIFPKSIFKFRAISIKIPTGFFSLNCYTSSKLNNHTIAWEILKEVLGWEEGKGNPFKYYSVF